MNWCETLPEVIRAFSLNMAAGMGQQTIRQAFLWGLGAVYLFAFLSLYLQIPGTFDEFASSRPVGITLPISIFCLCDVYIRYFVFANPHVICSLVFLLLGLYGDRGIIPAHRLMMKGTL